MSKPVRVRRALLTVFLWLAVYANTSIAAPSIGQQLSTEERLQLQREARLVVDLLQNHHYSGRAFREIENKEMIGRFVDELDPSGEFLTADDVAFIHGRFDRTLKSVYLFRGDLQPAFEVSDLLAGRVRDRLAWVAKRLDHEFDLTVDESFNDPHQPKANAAREATDKQWDRRLKDAVLTEMTAGRTQEEARAEVAKHYAETGRQISAFDSFAIREHFFDAVIRSFDPHSGYFSADSAREFAVDMENAVVGLGLDLRKEKGVCVVAAVQPGGPADLHSGITAGDIIVALAEGEGPWASVARLRLREIVALVRGSEPGGSLRVAYQPEGTSERMEVTLERTRVVLPADRAHGAISVVADATSGTSRRIGSIVLPSFYTGGEGASITSAAADMRELLEQMEEQKIDGLVLDLRANPGGAMTEALAVSRLFLSHGNIMLSRGLDGKVLEHALDEGAAVYAGPLVVLTSAQSASASEILSGAMKFHQRAVIVGSAATFGKGTAQAYIPLAKLPGRDSDRTRDWGTLRLTSEQFFLPDGSPVQRIGVVSQIVLPDSEILGWQREDDLPGALPGETVTPPLPTPAVAANLASAPDSLVQRLRERAEHDFHELPEWKLWRAEQQYRRTRYARETRSLRQETRQNDWADALTQFQSLQRTRRALAEVVAFPTQSLEIAVVRSAYAAHEAKLRATVPDSQAPRSFPLRRAGVIAETDHGRLREVPFAAINAMVYYGDAATLADAFGEGAGHSITEEEARRILQALPLMEHKTEAALLTAVRHITAGRIPSAALQSGTAAMFARLVKIDGGLCLERPALDVPLRECQRLAAMWAGGRGQTRTP